MWATTKSLELRIFQREQLEQIANQDVGGKIFYMETWKESSFIIFLLFFCCGE
jgi:hypothetical protein